MDVAQLFRAGVQVDPAPMPAHTSTIYGVALADSYDGTVLVQMDGDAVTQPGDESVEVAAAAEEFEAGTATLPSEPYPGTVEVYAEQVDDDHRLEESEYQVNGDRLTIEALAGGEPVDVEWTAHVVQEVTREDFAGGAFPLVGEPSNLSVTEDVGGPGVADWQPVAHDVDGTNLIVANMEPADGRVVATYVRAVSVVTSDGEQVLPDMPDPADVTVTGRTTDENNAPVEAVVTGWDLAGDIINIPAGYDTYTVDYSMPVAEEWNLAEQVDDEPLPDYDPEWDGGAQDADELEPDAVTVGHDLTWEPVAGTLDVTVDGVAAAYTLDGVTVTVTSAPPAERRLSVEYDAAQAARYDAAAFAGGTVALPSVPASGTVAVAVGGAALDPGDYSVADDALTIPGLVQAVAQYVVRYVEQVPTPAVELPTVPAVSEGDTVQITVVGGVPTVTGVQGSGDSAWTSINDATGMVVEVGEDLDAAVERIATNEGDIVAAQASIAENADNIAATVAAQVDVNNDLYTLVNQVIADANGLSITLTQLETTVADNAETAAADTDALANVVDLVNSAVDALVAYVRVEVNENNQPVLVLGSNTWPVQAQLTNTDLRFVENGTPVASISDHELNITTANVTDRINLGDWAWIPRSNGNLSLKWVG